MFLDVTDRIHTISTTEASWTATEDCYCIVRMNVTSSGTTVYASLNGATIASIAGDSSDSVRSGFYVKKGQVVTTSSSGTHLLYFYSLTT